MQQVHEVRPMRLKSVADAEGHDIVQRFWREVRTLYSRSHFIED